MANVLIYMSDEHNPRFSSVQGHPRVQTPNMERLAAMGTVFTDAYCPSPLCLPSRSAFMAGLPVHRIQSYNNCNAVTFDYPSYGSVLRDQGVYTAYFGKVDVYNYSSTLGFSEMVNPGDRKPPGDINFCRRPLSMRENAAQRGNGFGPREGAGAKDAAVVGKAADWIREKSPSLNTPWTVTVNTGAPHFPHYVTPELWEMYADAGDLPKHGMECATAQHPYAQDLRAHFATENFTEEQVRGLRRGYLGRVTFVDQQLGRLLDALEESGQLEDTVVIYTSDHGEMLGKFGMWWKCSLLEDSVRVPIIAAGPGFSSGQHMNTPVSLFDLQATIFAAVGRERPAGWWGAPLQHVSAHDDQRVVFAEYHGHGTRSGAFMVRKGDWKLIYNMAGPHQLFNLAEDPEELVNRYGDAEAVAKDLERELRAICSPEKENERAEAMEEKLQRLVENMR